jgi:RNA-directed DNA polymerase
MTVEALGAYLRGYWPTIREQLLAGIYEPAAVRRYEPEKDRGGIRILGIHSEAKVLQHVTEEVFLAPSREKPSGQGRADQSDVLAWSEPET